MKILLIQKDINNTDYLRLLDSAASKCPDLVCLGELATSGCLYNGGEGLTTETLLGQLEKYPFDIMIGYPKREAGQLYNTYMYYSKGDYQFYNKINLFEPMNETTHYQPGTELGLFDTPLGKVGTVICYDLRFPELFEQLAGEGAKIIFVPAAWPRVRIAHYHDLIIQRAKDNRVHIIGINAVGNDGTNEFGGTSMAVDPTGRVLVRADEINETVLEVEL